ncbi:hypothetical protein BH11MYX1_BH11MYX1_32130 [soil metagenome]
MRPVRFVALGLVATLGACITSVQRPPATGYGASYRGTGQGIYVLDSQASSLEIVEGRERISSEQALEASGDAEYEARRQIARDYNARVYREALDHKDLGNTMIRGGVAGIAIGLVLALVVAPRLRTETITPAMAGMPEQRAYTSGAAVTVAANAGVALALVGLVGVGYGYVGGKDPPPYHAWRTPPSLDRPAYVRQQTEPYNQKLGAPLVNPGGPR